MSSPDEQESMAKVILDLSESVKALKAELEKLKCRATYSGNDPRVSTQDSISEPGKDLPRQKDQGKATVMLRKRRRVKQIANPNCCNRLVVRSFFSTSLDTLAIITESIFGQRIQIMWPSTSLMSYQVWI